MEKVRNERDRHAEIYFSGKRYKNKKIEKIIRKSKKTLDKMKGICYNIIC